MVTQCEKKRGPGKTSAVCLNQKKVAAINGNLLRDLNVYARMKSSARVLAGITFMRIPAAIVVMTIIMIVAMAAVEIVTMVAIKGTAIIMTVGDSDRAMLPAGGDPDAARAAVGPVTRRPDVIRSRAAVGDDDGGRGADGCGRNIDGRRCRDIDRGAMRHHQDRQGRQRETEGGKAERNSGLGRQGCRADEGDREKQFGCFHMFYFLVHGVIAIHLVRREGFGEVTQSPDKSGLCKGCTLMNRTK